MDIITSLCLLGYCWGLKRFTRLSLESIPFLLVTSAITLLYISAYIHLLTPMSYALLIIGALLLLTLPYFWHKEPDTLYQIFFTPNFCSLLFYVIIFGIIAHQLTLSQWDEFTHWGPHAKLIYLHHGFYLKSDVTVNKSYPVGSALFYYPFFLLNKGFSEGTSYYAQLLLLLSPLFTLQPVLTWHKWKQSFIAFSAIIFIAIILKVRMGFSGSLYMDSATGLFIGAIIVNFFRSKGECADIFQIIPMAVALCLLKPKLYPFVLLILVIILVDLMVREPRKNTSFWLKIISMLSIPAAVYIVHYSWTKYTVSIDLIPQHNLSHVSTHLFFQTFFHPTQFQQAVIHNFLSKALSYAPLLSILLLLTIVSSFLMKNNKLRQRFNILSALLFLGVPVYYFGLLLIYLFTFVPNEAIDVASMFRYTNIYHLMLAMFVFYYLLTAITAGTASKKTRTIQTGMVMVIILSIVCAGLIQKIKAKNRQQFHQSIGFLRIAMKKIADKTKQYVKPNETVDIIWQNSTGIERAIIGYDLVPINANQSPSSIGKPYGEGDVWTDNLAPKKLMKQISHYDYLLVAHVDRQFVKQYGCLFPHHFVNLKPLTEYTICISPGFNGDMNNGCVLHTEKAYLFKVNNLPLATSLV